MSGKDRQKEPGEIPKIIHFCWLSGDKIPNDYQKFVEEWKTKLSDYQFIFWTTANFDITKIAWTKQAYELKRYAFVADYIRLWAVYNYGGFYLDMDVEVIKNFNDLLNHNQVFAFENFKKNSIEAGVFGAAKQNQFVKNCMSWYEKQETYYPRIAPEIWYQVYRKNNFTFEILDWKYFTAKNVATGQIELDESSYTIHHFNSNWSSPVARRARVWKQKIRNSLGVNSLLSKTLTFFITLFFSIPAEIIDEGLVKVTKKYLQRLRKTSK